MHFKADYIVVSIHTAIENCVIAAFRRRSIPEQFSFFFFGDLFVVLGFKFPAVIYKYIVNSLCTPVCKRLGLTAFVSSNAPFLTEKAPFVKLRLAEVITEYLFYIVFDEVIVYLVALCNFIDVYSVIDSNVLYHSVHSKSI